MCQPCSTPVACALEVEVQVQDASVIGALEATPARQTQCSFSQWMCAQWVLVRSPTAESVVPHRQGPAC
jgi:hypothetical protein